MICYDMDYFPKGIDMTSSNANNSLNYVEYHLKIVQTCSNLPMRENKHLYNGNYGPHCLFMQFFGNNLFIAEDLVFLCITKRKYGIKKEKLVA